MPDSSAPPCLLVVHGARGDLSRRKLLPSLARLLRQGRLPRASAILGVGRQEAGGDAAFRDTALAALEQAGQGGDDPAWWREHLFWQAVPEEGAEAYRDLASRISRIESELGLPGNRVFYLALPPRTYPATVEGLGAAGLNESAGWTRIVIEKPFGRDLASAKALNEAVHARFEERQIYRIDHYLGKDTVQNLLVFRFANSLFEPIWNRDRVRSVQITVSESLGIGTRAGYYDGAGVVRDMLQNHLTQLLALTAMEVPGAFDADAIRQEKAKLLKAVAPIDPASVVLGQYAKGAVEGSEAPGYLEEAGVPGGSRTATFAAVKLEVANWRWHGVPFYLRTGKRLPRRSSQIAVKFHRPPVYIFQPFETCALHSNVLVMSIQPDEGFDLHFDVKTPGPGLQMQTKSLRFRYAEAFQPLPDAYETLLWDVLLGDQTLFVHADEAEASWRLYEPLLSGEIPVRAYASGSWGPKEADRLLGDEPEGWITR